MSPENGLLRLPNQKALSISVTHSNLAPSVGTFRSAGRVPTKLLKTTENLVISIWMWRKVVPFKCDPSQI
jgi:hypothetical protein